MDIPMLEARRLYIKGAFLFCRGTIAGNDHYKGTGLRLQQASSLHFSYEAVKAKLGHELDAVQRRRRVTAPERSSTRVPLHSVC